MQRASGQLVFAIPRVSPLLSDEPNSFEIHLYSMLEIWKFPDTPNSRSSRQLISIAITGTYKRYYQRSLNVGWLDFHLSSKVFRYAALALASTMQSSKTYDSNGAGSAIIWQNSTSIWEKQLRTSQFSKSSLRRT